MIITIIALSFALAGLAGAFIKVVNRNADLFDRVQELEQREAERQR